MPEQCKYKSENATDYVCPHPEFKNDFCVFHIPKPTHDELEKLSKSEKRENQKVKVLFEREINKIIESSKEETISFLGFVFPFTDLRDITFKKSVDFSYASFSQGISFAINVVFEEHVVFNRAVFYNGSFYQTVFKKSANFSNATFTNLANFNDVTFEDKVFFNGVEFVGDHTTFHLSTFKDEVTFIEAKFGNEYENQCEDLGTNIIDFNYVNFENKSRFDKAIFNRRARFSASKFDGETNFSDTRFNCKADFNWASFNGEIKFWRTIFKEIFDFKYTKLEGDISFVGNEKRLFLGESRFQKINFLKNGVLSFDKANLSQASFLYTDLEKITFLDVDWYKNPRKNFWNSNRPQLRDEVRIPWNLDLFERVADNYRQLVSNYEKKRNFETAEYFHIGEMEIRRKKNVFKSSNDITLWGLLRSYFNATGFYWLSSRYGTNYTQGMIVLISLGCVLIPILFLFAGFQRSKENNPEPQRVINFNLIPNPEDKIASISQLWSGYLDSVSYTFSIITFQKDRFYVPIYDSLASQWALYLAMFLLTTQAALVLLAIRRQFKR